MATHLQKLILFGAAFLCFAPIFSLAQDQDVVTEFDPGITLAVDLPKRFRFDLYTGQEKSEEIGAKKNKIGAGISFRIKPAFKRLLDAVDSDKQHLLVLGATYEYSEAKETGATSLEHKLMLDATFRYDLPKKILVSNRNRLEIRWVNGDNHFRYRNRPLVERSFKLFKRTLTPYVAAEGFWDARYKKWNVFKFSSGVQVPIYRRTMLEVFYERQHCNTCGTKDTNIFGLNYVISFGLKKK